MSAPVGLLAAALATPQGFGASGLAGLAAGEPADRDMLRPPSLKGRVFQIDPMTGLVAALAQRLREEGKILASAERAGVVVSSRYGNQAILKSFGDRVRRKGQSPIQFAASGYNVAAGVAAMAGNLNGPSLAIAGESSGLSASLRRCRQLIVRGDADVMLAVVAEGSPDGGKAVAAVLVITRPEAAPVILDEAFLHETGEDDAFLSAARALGFAPWLTQDVSAVLRLLPLAARPIAPALQEA